MTILTTQKVSTMVIGLSLLLPTLAMASEHDHNHNHFNPALEALGNDIISLTVCYNNGYLSEQDQEPAFKNLIAYAGVDGEELGMYYMNSLGAKAEEIMTSEEGRTLWTQEFCSELTMVYLDVNQLEKKKQHVIDHQDHDHSHNHNHNHNHSHGHEALSADVIEEDVERGRLLRVN